MQAPFFKLLLHLHHRCSCRRSVQAILAFLLQTSWTDSYRDLCANLRAKNVAQCKKMGGQSEDATQLDTLAVQQQPNIALSLQHLAVRLNNPISCNVRPTNIPDLLDLIKDSQQPADGWLTGPEIQRVCVCLCVDISDGPNRRGSKAILRRPRKRQNTRKFLEGCRHHIYSVFLAKPAEDQRSLRSIVKWSMPLNSAHTHKHTQRERQAHREQLRV